MLVFFIWPQTAHPHLTFLFLLLQYFHPKIRMMKKIFTFCFVCLSLAGAHAQTFSNMVKKAAGKDSAIASDATAKMGQLSGNDEIGSALKEALKMGAQQGTQQLSAVDGFFKNAAVKILMPPEAVKAESTLRSMGLGKQVDDAILSMNRAAEDAAKSAVNIFINAIQQISIQDAVSILKGGDSAATTYLRQKTSASLTAAFRPIIDQSLTKTDATKYWNAVFSTYNKIPFTKKVNTDLNAYVTGKALSGIFYEVAQEEAKIRNNPVARTTDLLKKVFGK